MANRLDPSWSFPTLFLVKDGLAGAREMIISVTILSVAIEKPATLLLVKDGLAGARRLHLSWLVGRPAAHPLGQLLDAATLCPTTQDSCLPC